MFSCSARSVSVTVRHTHAQVVTNCSRLVAMLFQQLVNRMCSYCLFPACWQLATSLLSSTDLLQVVRTTLLSSCNLTSLLHACCEDILLTSCEICTCVSSPLTLYMARDGTGCMLWMSRYIVSSL